MVSRKIHNMLLGLVGAGLCWGLTQGTLTQAEPPTLLGTAWIIRFAPPQEAREAQTWTPLFEGIDFMRAEKTAPLQKVCALRIDTQAEGISFYTTGRHKDFKDTESETERTTTVDFLEENQLAVAVNANFYTPFNAQTRTTRGPANVVGLAVSDGVLVSGADANYPSFTFSSNRVGQIRVLGPEDPLDGVQTAVAGSSIVLKEGKVVKQGDQSIHPRTAVGISQDHRYIYLITIDGRQPLHSVGATLEEVGTWLLQFGAWEGLNLDGGGSTTMVTRDSQGKAKVLNVPVGNANISGYLRHNANHIGVRASALKKK